MTLPALTARIRATMAFLTPDPRHLDRADRRGRARRDRRLARRRPVPALGRLAGRARTSTRGRDRRRARRRPARARRPGEALRRPDGARLRTGDPRGATCPGCGTSSTGSASGARSSSSGPAGRPAGRRPAGARRDRRSRSGPASQRRLDETEPGRGADGPARGAATAPPDAGRSSGCSAAIAAKRLDRLDALPRDVGARIRGCRSTTSSTRRPPAVRRARRAAARQRARPVHRGALGRRRSMTPDDLGAHREMVRDLNQLLQRAARRATSRPDDVDEFLAQPRRVLPRRADARRRHRAARRPDGGDAVAACARCRPSSGRSSRTTMDALLRDDRLRWDLAQLAANLDQLLPGGLGERRAVQRRRSRSASRGRSSSSAGSRRSTRSRTSSTASGGPATSATIDRDEVRDLLGDGRGARPRRARGPRPTGSRRRATSSATATGWS